MPRSSRQRQTRLAFTPLPSSSPATKGYNKQIQDRAAAVTLSSSPHSKRSIKKPSQPVAGVERTILTPASQDGPEVKDIESDGSGDSEPIRSHVQHRKSNHLQRQTQIDFTDVRDPSSFSPPLRLSSSSSKRTRSSTKAGMFSTQQQQKAIVDISSDAESDDDDDLPSARKLLPSRITSVKTKSGRKTRGQVIRDESESEDEDTIMVKSKSSPILVESEDDEEDMPTTAGIQRRKRRRRTPDRDSFIASSPPQMNGESEDDLEIIGPPSKKRRREDIGSDDDEDEDPRTPGKRRPKASRKLSRREQVELDEDLDFLDPSSDIESPTRKGRSSQSARASARQKALEALKRKRSGTQDTSLQTVNADSDDAEDFDGEDDERDSVEHVQPTRSSQMFREEDDDKNFIASDGEADDLLGEPAELPLEFTHVAKSKAKELFKHAVEWFVQKKMNPAFQSDDEIYKLTFRKLDDEVSGLAGSKFTSAAWKEDFIYTLKARPDIAFEAIDRTEPEHAFRDTCDACNKTGRTPTYQIKFLGRPYDRQTLEDLAGNAEDEDDDSDSQSDNSNEPNWDADGHPIEPETHSWYVGKFCMSNARTAHALQHWRWHLNSWIITWLDSHGYNTAEQVLKRESLSTQKRRKYANKIADRMEAEGVVKQLYRDYRSNIDDARNSKQGRYTSGWD